MPYLLPLSPSPTLSQPARVQTITARLETPARSHGQHALAVADRRLLDIIEANNIRSLTCYEGARLLEGWVEGSAAVSMAWAAGLGKLGGWGEPFATSLSGGGMVGSSKARIREKDRKLAEMRYRGMLVEPPKDGPEWGQRVHLL